MIVFLKSDLYGYEEFNADTKEEALEILGRLYDDCKTAIKEDGEERRIGIVVIN